MTRLRPALGLLWLASCAAGPDYRVATATDPPATRMLFEGSRAGLEVPAPLRLIAAYGDDRWRFAGRVTFDAAAGGLVPGWDDRFVYLIDQATGETRAALPRSGPPPLAVAVDPRGPQVAALLPDRSALYWASPAAAPVHLVPHALDLPLDERASTTPIGELGWTHTAAARRLAFSAAGDRLLAGMALFSVPDGRELRRLRPDEVVLDAGFGAAIVARYWVEHLETEPAGWCGSTTSMDHVHVTRVEYRADGAAPVELPARVPTRASITDGRVWFGAASVAVPTSAGASAPPIAPAHPPSFVQGIGSIDLADDGRIAFVEAERGWIARDGVATALRLRDDVSRVEHVTVGGARLFVVAAEPGRAGERRAVYTLEPGGAAVTRVPGETGAISRAGVTVLTRRDILEVWDLADAPARRATYLDPSNPSTHDQARVAGARVVIRDSDGPRQLFEVHGPDGALHRIRVPGRFHDLWAVDDDGETLAAIGRDGLQVVSLADGRVTFTAPLAAEPWALATSAHVTAVGDADGRVQVWIDGVVTALDLGPRQDGAASLAISPDQRHLAIGTRRGRILVLAIER